MTMTSPSPRSGTTLPRLIVAVAGLALGSAFFYQANRWFRHTRAAAKAQAEALEASVKAADRQNELLAAGNRLLAAQRAIDAGATLGEALGWAATEIRESGGLSELVESRFIALSRDLEPVGAPRDDGTQADARWSRERGNLIVGLSGLGVTNFLRYMLKGADLGGVTLRGRTLDWMQVFDGNLERANLHDSVLRDCVFTHAELRGVRMQGCDLSRTVFAHTSLVGADLRGANVEKIVGWDGSDWFCANIHGVRNPPEGFVEFVLGQGGLSVPEEFWEEELLLKGLQPAVIPKLMESSETFAKRYRNNLQSALGIALDDPEVRSALVEGIKAYQAGRSTDR